MKWILTAAAVVVVCPIVWPIVWVVSLVDSIQMALSDDDVWS